jgi:hypothetical protein
MTDPARRAPPADPAAAHAMVPDPAAPDACAAAACAAAGPAPAGACAEPPAARPGADPRSAAAPDPAAPDPAAPDPADPFDGAPRTSALLAALAQGGPDRVTPADLALALRHRAMGMLLVVFGAPCMLPAPPPIPLICALGVLTVAFSLLTGRTELWLPPALARRSLPGGPLRAVLARMVPIARRLERICRPRPPHAASRPAKAVIGATVAFLAVLVLLPIPVFGNFTPGLAIAVTGLGLSERDGLVVGAGLALAALATAVTAGLGWAAAQAAMWAF